MPPTRKELRSGVVGGIVAGLLLVAVLSIAPTSQMRMQAALYGSSTLSVGWLAHMVHSTLLGLVYAVVAAVYTNWYVERLLVFTRRSKRLTGVVMPLVRRFSIGAVVAAGMGTTFGLVVWLALAGAALPLALGAYPFPQLDAIAVLGYVLYGLVLGTLYGIQTSRN